ncbi:MAG: hypothetical protein ABRQ38_10575 [Candidatus Eremiobacterota bacterium]
MARELMKPGLTIEQLAYITKRPLEELKKDLDIKIDLNLIAIEKSKKEPDLNSNEPDYFNKYFINPAHRSAENSNAN